MKKLVLMSFGLVLYSCGNHNSHFVEKVKPEKAKNCTVSQTPLGALISCPDGSETLIENGSDGKDGVNGKSCKVEQLVNGAKISCEDGSFAYIYNGKDGTNGKDGKDGSSCTITGNKDGATIKCDDGSEVSINNGKDGADGKDGSNGSDGKDGNNGSDGKDGKDGLSCSITDLANGALITCGSDSAVIYDGKDALAGAIGISGYIRPCGNEFANEEIFLRLTDGNILALYDGGPNLDRLVLLAPGNYITTDRPGKTCHFTIDSDLNIINQVVK